MADGQRNLLYNFCAGGAVTVGVFLLLGAWGHFEAMLPLLGKGGADERSVVALLLPSTVLAIGGIGNGLLCKFLWDGRQGAYNAALVLNGLVLAYLGYLLWVNVPGHPLVLFAGIVASFIVLLAATRAGLRWPATHPL